MPIFFALQVLHSEDLVACTHLHDTTPIDPCGSEQHGAAKVRVNVDGRIQPAEADQVVEL